LATECHPEIIEGEIVKDVFVLLIQTGGSFVADSLLDCCLHRVNKLYCHTSTLTAPLSRLPAADAYIDQIKSQINVQEERCKIKRGALMIKRTGMIKMRDA
jgi:hypothetical protein